MLLSDVVTPNAMVARSVNIERDLGDAPTLAQYILTAKGLEIITRLAASLHDHKISAWSLTGPYGMGKSSFSNFLLSLSGPAASAETQLARQLLKDKSPELDELWLAALSRRHIETCGFFRIPATSAFQPVNVTLAKGLRRALQSARSIAEPAVQSLIPRVDELLSQDHLNAQTLFELFQQTSACVGAPLLIVIDELGKNLEFMARYPASGDLYLLQLLAEAPQLYLWVCLHQAFDEYASGFSSQQLREWGKIQGRFEDIPFVEPKLEMRHFIHKVLVRKPHPPPVDRAIGQWAAIFAEEARQLGLKEFAAVDAQMIEGFYPLHPLAAALLPELCVRFAQNDRTLFSFLCGGDPHALPAFLTSHHLLNETAQWATLPPDRLYDFFLSSAHGMALNRPESRRWLEINAMIQDLRGLPPPHYQIIKIIGLLNLISGPSGFRASRNLIRFALLSPLAESPIPALEIEAVLEALRHQGILNYRKYADEYRLWEGTDFDVSAAIQTQRERLAGRPLSAVLEKILPLSPLIASRHSCKTGTLRYFERRWLAPEHIGKNLSRTSAASDGLMLYCLSKEEAPPELPATTVDGYPLIIAYARDAEQARDLALFAAAAAQALTAYPELERDGIARKEAHHRANEAALLLKRFLIDLFTPGHPDVRWLTGGQPHDLKSFRDLSALLSSLCDTFFPDCPKLHNELINRQQLSGAAARARRELIEAMLTRETAPQLGMTGFGPEVAIYRAMLLAEGLHQQTPDGLWRLAAPAPQSSYFPAWRAIESMMNQVSDGQTPLTALIHHLKQPPFGLKDGPIPVLIGLYLFVHADEIALYQDGVYIPDLGPEDMELLVKRPEFFTIKRFIASGLQGRIFRVYQELLNATPVAQDDRLRNASMVNIVGPLVQFADKLPAYVKTTRTLSADARHVRQTLLNAKDPIDLLFAQLPQAVGIQPFNADESAEHQEHVHEFQIRFRRAIGELAQAFPALLRQIQQAALSVFHQKTVAELRQDAQYRAQPLIARTADKRLKPFLSVLANAQDPDDPWLLALAVIVAQKPVESWSDTDLQVFITRLHDLNRQFTALEAIAAAEHKLPKSTSRRHARHIAVTLPNGETKSQVIWVETQQMKHLEQEIRELQHKFSPDDLKGLLALLGEQILTKTESL